MECELRPPLYHTIREVAPDFQQCSVRHQPWVLVAIFLWAM